MRLKKRPLLITIVGLIYIAVGIVGFVYHFPDLQSNGAFHYDGVWIEFIRCLAVVAAVAMLRGDNWGRWLALIWIAAHVILSAFHEVAEFTMHCLFFVVIGWMLFRPDNARYFQENVDTAS